MNIVILMGSPRLCGNTAELCKPFIEELKENGAKVRYVTLADKDIHSCKGCYTCQEVAGFIGLKKDLVEDYMILDQMHVSAICRGQGTGRKLFEKGKEEAKKAGAKALYISACSSEETIAFYNAMGARLTDCPIKELAEAEPCDLQMVCKI